MKFADNSTILGLIQADHDETSFSKCYDELIPVVGKS